MGLIGSILGGAIGFALGGPLGAIGGAALGHTLGSTRGPNAGMGGMGGMGATGGMFEPDPRQGRRRSGPQRVRAMDAHEQAQTAYFISVFSMMAKMARADGVVSQEEIDLTQRFMRQSLQLDKQSEQAAVKVFRAAKDSPIPFDQFARQFGEIFRTDDQMRLTMLDLLAKLAASDGKVSAGEKQMLQEAARIWRLSEDDLRHILGSHGADDHDRYYDVLGLEPTATMAEVKSAYRKLVTEYHPDKIIAKGLPDEFVEFAESRFREIQEAYEKIQAQKA